MRVRTVLEELLRDGAVVASDGSVHPLSPVAIGSDEGEALGRWVRDEGAESTIEIGLGYGVSTLFICEAVLDVAGERGRHLAIDPNQSTRFANCGLHVLDSAGVRSLVEFHDGESQIVLPRLVSAGRTFDLAFVDGDHRFEAVFLDLVFLGRLVRPGGVVFIDDFQLPAIGRAVSFFVTNLDWRVEETSDLDPGHHWAVLRTAAQRRERAWDDFVEF